MKCLGTTTKTKDGVRRLCDIDVRPWWPFCRHHGRQVKLWIVGAVGFIGSCVTIQQCVWPIFLPPNSIVSYLDDTKRQQHGFELNSKYGGFHILFVISVSNIDREVQKFIFDSGSMGKNGVSLFLDRANNLVYQIVDEESVPQTLKIPQGKYTFKADQQMVVFLDYGYNESGSYMRILINDEELGEKVNRFPLNLPKKLDLFNTRFGCDLTGNYCTDHKAQEPIIWGVSLSDEEHLGKFEDAKEYYNIKI